MIELSTVRDLVAIFGVIAGFSYYVLTVRNNQKTQKIQTENRQTQLFMQFIDKVHSPEFLTFWVKALRWEWNDLEDFEHKYGSVDHPELFGERYSCWSVYNDLGYLVEKGIVQIPDVNALVGPIVFWSWDKFEPIILEHRRVYNFPDQYIYWEHLYQKLMEYRKSENMKIEVPEYYDDYISTTSNR